MKYLARLLNIHTGGADAASARKASQAKDSKAESEADAKFWDKLAQNWEYESRLENLALNAGVNLTSVERVLEKLSKAYDNKLDDDVIDSKVLLYLSARISQKKGLLSGSEVVVLKQHILESMLKL
jgi:hypothetical protein